MLKRVIVLCLLAGLLIGGIVHLFLMRFESGDVYARYSSLRTDPLGTKAFHDALCEVPELRVLRNYRPIEKFRSTVPVTLIYAGTAHRAWWGEDELRSVEALAAAGSRVVISFLPERSDRSHKSDRTYRSDGSDEPEQESLVSFEQVAESWGFKFTYLEAAANPDNQAVVKAGGGLEPALVWNTTLAFFPLQAPWTTIYECGGKPALIERSYGKGSLVLAADSYFLSNEALRNNRSPRLLAWLVGARSTVVFDEESHGVRENPGLASLINKYGLKGAMVALLGLALLFIWKNALPLVPPLDEDFSADGFVRGKDSSAGFINLLRRTIAPRELLGVCAGEWKKAFDHDGHNAKSAEIDEVLAQEEAKVPRQRDSVAAYAAICTKLARNAGGRRR